MLDLLDLLPLEHRHKSPQTRSQHKLLNQSFPTRAKKQKEDYNPKAWKKESSSGARQKKKKKEREKRQRNTAQMKKQGRDS